MLFLGVFFSLFCLLLLNHFSLRVQLCIACSKWCVNKNDNIINVTHIC